MLAPAPDLSIESARRLCDSGPGLSRRIAAQQASAAFRASPYRRQPQSPVPGLRPRWWPSEPGTLSRCCSGSTRTGIDGDDERRLAPRRAAGTDHDRLGVKPLSLVADRPPALAFRDTAPSLKSGRARERYPPV